MGRSSHPPAPRRPGNLAVRSWRLRRIRLRGAASAPMPSRVQPGPRNCGEIRPIGAPGATDARQSSPRETSKRARGWVIGPGSIARVRGRACRRARRPPGQPRYRAESGTGAAAARRNARASPPRQPQSGGTVWRIARPSTSTPASSSMGAQAGSTASRSCTALTCGQRSIRRSAGSSRRSGCGDPSSRTCRRTSSAPPR